MVRRAHYDKDNAQTQMQAGKQRNQKGWASLAQSLATSSENVAVTCGWSLTLTS